MSSPNEISLLVRALARYWRAHPFASDDCEGIAQWWLFLPPGWTWHLQLALDSMVAAGLVECLQAVDGRIRYRRVRDPGNTDVVADTDDALRRLADNDGSNNGKGDA